MGMEWQASGRKSGVKKVERGGRFKIYVCKGSGKDMECGGEA